MKKLKTLVVGCGNMGSSHALAYSKLDGFEIVGLVSRKSKSREKLARELDVLCTYAEFGKALKETKPDVVSINTYPDTHAKYAQASLEAGAHVFVEKPLALTVEEAKMLVLLAQQKNRKLVIGYILRVHPTWKKFVEGAQKLGKPLVMRMNLNQQSSGESWYVHKQLMSSISPIVDCGVHYVDIMCMMTKSVPISVYATGVHLSYEIDSNMYNYGQLQVRFKDGSMGWYEAGWGPMMSETASSIKDVMGPKGSISMMDKIEVHSDDIEGHTKTNGLKLHHSDLDLDGNFTSHDELFETKDEPGHDGLCLLEQEFFLKTIVNDIDLSAHMQDAVNSLAIVLAADKSIRTGKVIELELYKL